MDRRKFLRIGAALGAGLSLPGGVAGFFGKAWALPGTGGTDLAVAKGDSPAALVRAAVDALGGMGRFVGRGDIVVVKPNIGWDRAPEQAANTNPQVVAEVVRLCFEAGARKVKVFDRTVNDPRRCYVQSGIREAAAALGADVRYVSERKFREVDLKGEALKRWPIYQDVMEADRVINVPIAKHHGLATLTLAMKNWMGVMGGKRSRIHQKLPPALADLAGFIKPTLTVLDAVRVLVANGPQGGSLEDVRRLDTVVAGVDQVAVDSFGATLFGLRGEDLASVREGRRRGLGVADLERLSIARLAV